MHRPAPLAVTMLALAAIFAPASAQIAIPDAGSKSAAPVVVPRPAIPAPWSAPAVVPAPSAPALVPGQIGGNDAQALADERALPLDPATRNLRNQLPADPQAVKRQLGLRDPVGPVTDLRGHTPSPQEIANGLNRR